MAVNLIENFANKDHQMQKNRNNCFGWKQHNKTFHQAKISNHEYARLAKKLKLYQNVMIYLILLNITIFSCIPIFFILVLSYFCPMKARAILFLPETIVANLLHLMMFICNVFTVPPPPTPVQKFLIQKRSPSI